MNIGNLREKKVKEKQGDEGEKKTALAMEIFEIENSLDASVSLSERVRDLNEYSTPLAAERKKGEETCTSRFTIHGRFLSDQPSIANELKIFKESSYRFLDFTPFRTFPLQLCPYLFLSLALFSFSLFISRR